MKKCFRHFNLNPPVGIDAVGSFERSCGIKLPQDYLTFLTIGNGGEGFIGPKSYAILWRLEELWQFNAEYEVSEYAPGLFLIGSNGGGEAFAYDTRESPWPVVQVPFVGMALELAEPLGSSFIAFLETLYEAD